MQLEDLIKVGAPAIAILSAVIALTRYITTLQLRPTKEQHESETASLRERIATLNAQHEAEVHGLNDRIATLEANSTEVGRKYERLLQDLAVARRVGTAALLKKSAIDDELSAAAETLRASASSLLVRSPSLLPGQSQQDELIFVSISGPAAAKLKRTRVPIRGSIAGSVFTSGKPHLTPNAQADPSFYDKVDQASHYRTEDMLAWPLTFRGQIVGVAQFLNKQGGGTFQPNDLRLAEVLAPSLAAKVADFVQSTENFEILGITLERESEQAAVFVCDLTNSSLLLNTLPTPVATDLINSYLELAADVTMRHGATIDQFLGDGAMIRFNVPRRVNGHVEQAIKAAQELQHRFDELKSQWTAGGYPVAKVYSRVGLASGPVYQVLMGHPQFQHLTLMGPTVSLANALCEAGDRTRNVILVNEEIAGQEIPPFSFAPVPREQMGKAARIVSVAYVVEGEAARVAVP